MRPSGTQQWKQLCWPNLGSDPAKKRGSATDVVLGPRLSCRPRVTYLRPHAEHRSATERKCRRGRCALRCVSKHEGANISADLIPRDARTCVAACGTVSACALLGMRTAIAREDDSTLTIADSPPRSRGASSSRHSGAQAKPASPESIPTACGYGFRPSPLSRLGRNDELKAFAPSNTSSFPRRVFCARVLLLRFTHPYEGGGRSAAGRRIDNGGGKATWMHR